MKRLTLTFIAIILICFPGSAYDLSFQQARSLQNDGKFEEAIDAYKGLLSKQDGEEGLTDRQLVIYTDALVQMMNTYQSKGDPEGCISALKEVFEASPVLQSQCLRDYYSVLGYALSRTEYMAEAEEAMLKALRLPLQSATPERYFRDYAYAAAVFYSNPAYQDEVINWCKEALAHADRCNNTSGKQWVTAMLGALYKKNGDLHQALEFFQQSKEEAQSKGDDLGVLNSLHSLVDLFLYWDIPEYADVFATEAVRVERSMSAKNPMVSAQTYINKGRALHQLGRTDSISFYNEQARKLCESLPYNSGMVDVNLLNGIYLTEKGGESLEAGIKELHDVTLHATAANRAKAYHQLAQTYLRHDQNEMAEVMLDSLITLLCPNGSQTNILHIDYKPILDYYLKTQDRAKREKYVDLLIQEHKVFKQNRVNADLVEAIVDFQTEKKIQELKITQLTEANKRLWLIILLTGSALVILIISVLLFRMRRRYRIRMREVDTQIDSLVQQLNESNAEKEIKAQEIKEFLKDKDKRQELETLTPFILKESGEIKFRQCFELLHPLFLHRLREKVPTITRREELLSMLIVLKQDNKEIADLLAVAPRSILMLRHRFRQKIGLTSEYSLENFIEGILSTQE
jgi:tetratricopeptide (TPR) repeat protein/DNA-binding CsgD family transcriptional regulator